MELKDKAKVVASVWGVEFVQFLAALAVLFALVYLKAKGRIHPIFPNGPRQNQQRGKELHKFCPQTDATTFALSSNSILLLCSNSMGILPLLSTARSESQGCFYHSYPQQGVNHRDAPTTLFHSKQRITGMLLPLLSTARSESQGCSYHSYPQQGVNHRDALTTLIHSKE